MIDSEDALIIEPRAVPFTQEDPSVPVVGKWYWLSVTETKHLGWEPKKNEDDDDVPIESKSTEKVFVCVVRLGSNYAKVRSLSGATWRIHFDEFHAECEWIPEPARIIAGETKLHQDKVVLLMQEIREVTARLAITPGLGLPGAPVEAQSVGLVLAKGKPATEYKTALIKAEEETLPELFKRIKEEHAEMALWMGAPLIPLQASSDAMKPAIAAIKDRLFSVELYAGLCEEVVQIKKGEPAKLQEKIRIFQRRAYMDEECLAAYEVGGMDYKSLADFDKWLCKPAQLERLMPFPRCVLAFRIRREKKEREMVTLEDYFRIREQEKWDKSTFLYIRNGERMYRLETSTRLASAEAQAFLTEELALILEMLPKLKWEVQVADASATGDPTAKFYLGTAPGWRVTVVSFDIEPQGFPPGSRGYDGAASHSSKLVHLTRELAERAFKLAAGTE